MNIKILKLESIDYKKIFKEKEDKEKNKDLNSVTLDIDKLGEITLIEKIKEAGKVEKIESRVINEAIKRVSISQKEINEESN